MSAIFEAIDATHPEQLMFALMQVGLQVASRRTLWHGDEHYPLEYACERWLPGARILLEFGCRTLSGLSSGLHSAVVRSDIDTITLLLQFEPENINGIMNYRTALDLAVENDHHEIIRILVCAGAEGRASLLFAARLGKLKIVQFFFQIRPETYSIEIYHLDLLNVAIRHYHLHIVEYCLLVPMGEIKDPGKNPLYIAVNEGHLSIIDMILRAAPQLLTAPTRDSLVWMAISNNRIDIAEMLLQAGASTTSPPHTAIYILRTLFHDRKYDMLGWVADHDLFPDTDWLHTSCIHGQIHLVRRFLSAKINHPLGRTAQTPLSLALKYQYEEIFQVLIGSTYLDFSTWIPSCVRKLVRSLVKYGKESQWTALLQHIVPRESSLVNVAVRYGNAYSLVQLVQLGFPVDTPDRSPFQCACASGNIEMMTMLVKIQTDRLRKFRAKWGLRSVPIDLTGFIDQEDSQGVLPLQRAIGLGKYDVIVCLIQLGSTALDKCDVAIQRYRDSSYCKTEVVDLLDALRENSALPEATILRIRGHVYFGPLLPRLLDLL